MKLILILGVGQDPDVVGRRTARPGYPCFRPKNVIPAGQLEEYMQLFLKPSGIFFFSIGVANLVKYKPKAISPPP